MRASNSPAAIRPGRLPVVSPSSSLEAEGPAPRSPRTGRILAIVPALNEAASVGGVVAALRNVPGLDICVVDDGSTDGTADIARRAGASVIVMPFNVGIGGAVQVGYRLARSRGYGAAIQVDGDGQHPAEEIPRLLTALSEHRADLVVGSRFAAASGYRPSFARHVGIRLLRSLLSRCCGTRLTDTTSGFRVAGPTAIELFARQYPHDYPEVESLVLAARSGMRVVEIPVSMRLRTSGQSSITPSRSAYYMFKVILAVGVQLLRPRTGGADTR
jgi:glycosyltransferase involved in cell wall biosynthesis